MFGLLLVWFMAMQFIQVSVGFSPGLYFSPLGFIGLSVGLLFALPFGSPFGLCVCSSSSGFLPWLYRWFVFLIDVGSAASLTSRSAAWFLLLSQPLLIVFSVGLFSVPSVSLVYCRCSPVSLVVSSDATVAGSFSILLLVIPLVGL